MPASAPPGGTKAAPGRAGRGRPVKVVLIGDAARQRPVLAPLLPGIEVAELPREAAISAQFDSAIASDDVVVSLRFRRTDGAPPFALLHVPGAGLDGIELDALQQGCRVCNVFEHETPIAEYVLLQMLSWEIRPESMRFTAQSWGEAHRNRRPHGELAGKSLGIVGFGRIGRAIAERARAFGMRIVALNRSLGDGAHLVDEAVAPDRLADLLGACDYVALACPLTEQTRGLIDAAALAAMRPSGVLINVSRAEIVDEQALYDALSENRIGGAVLDVWYRYPAGADDNPAPSSLPFLDLPNVVATAHSSAWTTALPGRRYRLIAENIRRLSAGEPLLNQVWPMQPATTRKQTS
jgi:phosphoglycerate dehydrogenase-like enzyme